jgi:hypothetical protein
MTPIMATIDPTDRDVVVTNRTQLEGWLAMTSLRQLEANRRNALKSSGPKTESGKQTSRCNAVRHGLTAESVIGALEDAEDYKAFEAAVAAGFDAETAVERELVLRLASLLWRLRRATAIDTGLLETTSEVDTAPDLESATPANEQADGITEFLGADNHMSLKDTDDKGQNDTLNSEIARRFLQLDSKCFEQLGRYETALWRQVYQVIFVLNVLRRQNLDRSWLPRSSSSPRLRPFGSLLPKA